MEIKIVRKGNENSCDVENDVPIENRLALTKNSVHRVGKDAWTFLCIFFFCDRQVDIVGGWPSCTIEYCIKKLMYRSCRHF